MLHALALAATSLALSAKQASAIDRIVLRVMHDARVPGLSLGIARDGRVLYLRGYGRRDPARALPADPYTIYRIGSLTKAFTATLVLGAAERGELSLAQRAPDGRSVAELLAQIDGDAWRYDNANYLALGDLLASATHEPFARLLDERIVAPLALVSTSAALPRARNVAAAPLARPRDDPTRTGSAAGMSSNVPDLLRFLAALDRGALISRDDLRAMTTTRTLADGRPTHYGYGFFVTDWYGWPVAEHPGYLDGFSALDALGTDDGVALVILTNADRVDLTPLAKSLFAIVERPRDRTSVARFGQAPENEDPAATAALSAALAQLAKGTIARALVTDSYARRLTPDALQRFAMRLAPLGPLRLAEFLARDGDVERYRLTFARTQASARMTWRDGKIAGLVLEQSP
ncbi:MAG: beta-lactamase family protein [bacterium]|nr:beta-lactamase family protein [bacterium]